MKDDDTGLPRAVSDLCLDYFMGLVTSFYLYQYQLLSSQ